MTQPDISDGATPPIGRGLREQAARSLVWTALESGGLSALSFVTLVVLSHLLTPADFGAAALALSVVQILNAPVELFSHDALVRAKSATRLHFDTAFTVSVALGIALCVTCLVGADFLAAAVNQPDMAPVLRWMSLSLVAMGFGSTIIAQQRRSMAFRPLALRSLIGRSGAAAIGVALAFLGAGVWSLVAQQVLMVALATAVLWVAAEERPRFRFSLPVLRELSGFGTKSVTIALVGYLMARIFMLLVGRFLGGEAAGYFNLAFRCVEMLRSLLSGAVSQLALPIFSRHRHDRSALTRAFNNSIEFTCAVTYPVFAALMALSPDVTRIVFGEKWLPAAPIITILCIISLQFFARQFTAPMMAAVGRPLYPLAAQTITVAIAVIGMAMIGTGVVPSTIHAAAIVWLIACFTPWPLDAWMLRRASGIGMRAQWRGLPRVLLATGIMIAAMIVFRERLVGAFEPPVRLTATLIVGAGTYGIVSLILNRSLVIRLVDFARTAIDRA